MSTDRDLKSRIARRLRDRFALGRCTRCDVVVLPIWVRKLSVLWWWDHLGRKVSWWADDVVWRWRHRE